MFIKFNQEIVVSGLTMLPQRLQWMSTCCCCNLCSTSLFWLDLCYDRSSWIVCDMVLPLSFLHVFSFCSILYDFLIAFCIILSYWNRVKHSFLFHNFFVRLSCFLCWKHLMYSVIWLLVEQLESNIICSIFLAGWGLSSHRVYAAVCVW